MELLTAIAGGVILGIMWLFGGKKKEIKPEARRPKSLDDILLDNPDQDIIEGEFKEVKTSTALVKPEPVMDRATAIITRKNF